jgi:hypothetical protein
MNKKITFGLIASVLALSTAAFAPTEAQARDHNRDMNRLAMQMYMNNQAIAAQQQFNYNNPYLYNNAFNNGYYNRMINGNGCYTNNRWNNGWNNGYYNNGYYNNGIGLRSVGRILNRIF